MREIIIETKRIGNILRVIAMDTVTCIEVSFQAPTRASPEAIKRLAAAKLSYVLKKKPD